jgi:hypothetical protein
MIWKIILYCSAFATPEYTKKAVVVVAFTETKALTYNPELGYVEWDIIKSSYLRYENELLQNAEFFVKNAFGQGYIFVYPDSIEHYSSFTVDDKTFRFHIKYKRKLLSR